jgi:uncharacterized protein DUF1275
VPTPEGDIVKRSVKGPLAIPDLTTTVLTLTLTGIAADSSLAHGNNVRLARRIGAVLAMFAGAALGAVVICSRLQQRWGLRLPSPPCAVQHWVGHYARPMSSKVTPPDVLTISTDSSNGTS